MGEDPTDSTAMGSFTEQLWELDEKVLIQRFIVANRRGDADTSLAILQAKATLAAQAAADETKELAGQTRKLAWATVVLAVATVLLVVVTVVK